MKLNINSLHLNTYPALQPELSLGLHPELPSAFPVLRFRSPIYLSDQIKRSIKICFFFIFQTQIVSIFL